MTNTHQPDPAEIARLVETDELIRYAVEELGGQIIAIRDLYDQAVISSERRKTPSWRPISLPLPVSSHPH